MGAWQADHTEQFIFSSATQIRDSAGKVTCSEKSFDEVEALPYRVVESAMPDEGGRSLKSRCRPQLDFFASFRLKRVGGHRTVFAHGSFEEQKFTVPNGIDRLVE